MSAVAQESRYQFYVGRRNSDQVSNIRSIRSPNKHDHHPPRFSVFFSFFLSFFFVSFFFFLFLFREQPFFLYRMSYLWYTWVGCLTAIVVGLLVSWITGPNKRKPGDEKLYTPVIRSLLHKTATIVGKRQQVRRDRCRINLKDYKAILRA